MTLCLFLRDIRIPYFWCMDHLCDANSCYYGHSLCSDVLMEAMIVLLLNIYLKKNGILLLKIGLIKNRYVFARNEQYLSIFEYLQGQNLIKCFFTFSNEHFTSIMNYSNSGNNHDVCFV